MCCHNRIRRDFNSLRSQWRWSGHAVRSCYKESVLPFVFALIAVARVFFQSRTDIAVELLALRQQVAVLKRRRPRHPLRTLDRLFWTLLRVTWSRWRDGW